MRAWEILENRQPPSKPITLRNLHQQKIQNKKHEEELRQRYVLMSLMYGDPDIRRERQEVERLELELELLRKQVRIEIDSAPYDEIAKMAKSGIDASQKSDAQLTKLARSGLGRERKPVI